MQKHERLALEAARAVAEPKSCHVWIEFAARGHPQLVVVGPRGTRKNAVSSSPRNRDDAANYARQWTRRIMREIA